MLQQLAVANQRLLNQLEDFLRQVDPAEYALLDRGLCGASLGQHTRHILEFYQCLLQGLDSGVLDYDARQRRPDWEADPQAAWVACAELSAGLANAAATGTLVLQANMDLEPGQPPQALPTSLERELLYVHEHTVHHLAILKIGVVQRALAVRLPEHFGVANSTWRHRVATQAGQ